MKFELRTINSEEAVDVTNSENINTAKKYFIGRKKMDIEAFDRLFEVVEKKVQKK
tara:strand:- start:8 stop:172 length:165 start_codon:yes stop_codon:yes gene_type:complete